MKDSDLPGSPASGRRGFLFGGAASVFGMTLPTAKPAGAQTAAGCNSAFTEAGLFSELRHARFGADVTMIQTSGHSRPGIGAAIYVRDGQSPLSEAGARWRAAALADGIPAATVNSALRDSEGRWRALDLDGRAWTLHPAQKIIDTMFGAVHDAAYEGRRNWNSRWTGTDCRAAIQAMIDWSVYFGGGARDLYLGPGRLIVSDTLHIGYGIAIGGTTYANVGLRGSGAGYVDLPGAATVIARNFAGRPLINVAGGRGVTIDALATFGTAYEYLLGNGFGVPDKTPTVDETRAESWEDPAIAAALGRPVDHRNCPDAAIVIDGYAGAEPELPYPRPSFPAWLGAPSRMHYGQRLTSHDTSIGATGIHCTGETNVIVTCPSGTVDSNSDYTTIGRLNAYRCKRAISITHTQSRGAKIGYLMGAAMYEVFSNNAHGKRKGHIGASLDHISVTGLVQLGSIGSSAESGPITIRNAYVEAGYRLLLVEGGTTIESTILIENSRITFDLQGPVRGIPAAIVGRATSENPANVPLELRGGHFSNFLGAFNLRTSPVTFTGGTFIDPLDSGAYVERVPPYRATFHNGTAGGIVVPAYLPHAQRSRPHLSRFFHRNIDTGEGSEFRSIECGEAYPYSDRRFCIPFYAPTAAALDERLSERVVHPQPTAAFDKASFSSSSEHRGTDHYEWNFSYGEDSLGPETFGGVCGDVCIDGPTGMVFVVRSYNRRSNAAILRALTNIRKRGGRWQPIRSFDPGSGTLYALCLRRYTPRQALFATFTKGSTRVALSDGGGEVSGEIWPGDRIAWRDGEEQWTGPAGALVTDVMAGGLALSGPAARGGTRRMATLTRTIPNG